MILKWTPITLADKYPILAFFTEMTKARVQYGDQGTSQRLRLVNRSN